MTTTRAESERRIEAPHPGPLIKRDYLDVLGIAVADVARHAGIDIEALSEMLAGERSIDVDAAIRIARALQLPAERIMRMQIRRDFADARLDSDANAVAVLVPDRPPIFPETFVRGRLARASESTGDGSLFFQETLSNPVEGDAYAGMHALWRGDLLRVYDTEERPIWTGPVLADFDGRVLLPYVRTEVWVGWFAERRRADLHFGPEHAAFFERMAASAYRV